MFVLKVHSNLSDFIRVQFPHKMHETPLVCMRLFRFLSQFCFLFLMKSMENLWILGQLFLCKFLFLLWSCTSLGFNSVVVIWWCYCVSLIALVGLAVWIKLCGPKLLQQPRPHPTPPHGGFGGGAQNPSSRHLFALPLCLPMSGGAHSDPWGGSIQPWRRHKRRLW